MLKIQTELEKEPKPDFMEIRNQYRVAVKNWLDSYSSQKQQTGK